MRIFILAVIGVSIEELQEKLELGGQTPCFSGVGVAGAGLVWHDILVELVDFLEWSFSKHTLRASPTAYVLCYLI